MLQFAAAGPPWVISPAVACLSGLKSAPRKRVRGNPPRVQIPPPPPTDKAKRRPRHKVGAGVRGLGLIFGLIWPYFDHLALLGSTRAARRADSPRRCESEQRRVRSGLPSPSLTSKNAHDRALGLPGAGPVAAVWARRGVGHPVPLTALSSFFQLSQSVRGFSARPISSLKIHPSSTHS